MLKKLLPLLLALVAPVAFAQQFQTQTAPLFSANAKYLNGTSAGYAPTAGSGLTLNISAGRVRCVNTMTNYAGGTLTLTNATTNYVFLDTGASCASGFNTTGYTSTLIPIATVITSGGAITSITDDRTLGFATSAASVTSVGGTSPISSSGGATPSISCPTCVTSASPLTDQQIVSGSGGGQGAATAANPSLAADSTPDSVVQSYTNDTSTGTANKLIAKLSANDKIIKVGTSDTEAVGIVVSGGGTSGSAKIAVAGTVTCTFDNTSTAGHYVQISTGTAGDCTDAGASVPSTGGTIIGRVASGGSAGDHTVTLALTPPASSASGTVTTTGSPANPDLACFSGATSITNCNLSGDATTSNSAVVSVVKVNGASIPTSANLTSTNGSSQFTASTADNVARVLKCVAASGSGTAYTCSTSPTFTPANQDRIQFQADVANTGSATLNVNSTSAKTIKKVGGSANLVANDLLASQWVDLVYDGTNWQMQGSVGNAPTTGTVTSIATTSPITGGTITSTGTIACATCVTASSPGAGVAHFAGSTQAVTSSAVIGSDMTNQTVTGTQLAVVQTYRVCMLNVGSDNAAAALVDADLGPQGKGCFVPYAATIVELTVAADAGTPSVIPRTKTVGGTNANIVSSALATGSSGAVACSNTGGTTGIDGTTTCSSTLQNTSITAGMWLELTSGTAGGTAKRMSISITYTVN